VTLSIAVVCEGPADRRTGCDIADRVVCEQVRWIEDELLGHLRQWRGVTAVDAHFAWTEVKRRAKTNLIPLDGFGGEKVAPDAHTARKALWLLRASADPSDAVVMLRDDDGDVRRKEGLELARKYSKPGVPIVLGVAHLKREAWVLAGFEPQGKDENARLAQCRQELGFDPRKKAEQLTAVPDDAKKSAKRVLKFLTGGDLSRETQCWRETNLDLLEQRGESTGLKEYVKEVRTYLAPLFTKRPGTN